MSNVSTIAEYANKLHEARREVGVAAIYVDDGAPFSAADCLDRASKLLREAGTLRNTAMLGGKTGKPL